MRRYLLLGSGQLGWLAEQLDTTVQDWAREWLPGGTCTSDVVAAAVPPSEAGEGWLTVAAGGRCHLRRDMNTSAAMLFGTDVRLLPSALAGEAQAQAMTALATACLGGAAEPEASAEPPLAAEWGRGSGAVVLTVHHAAGTLTLVLDGVAVATRLARRTRAPAARPPLQGRRTAIGSARVQLGVSIGEAAIDIASLQTLGAGDVLPLDLRIDGPLRLQVDGRRVASGAFLGRLEGRRAVRVTAGMETNDTKTSARHHDN